MFNPNKDFSQSPICVSNDLPHISTWMSALSQTITFNTTTTISSLNPALPAAFATCSWPLFF